MSRDTVVTDRRGASRYKMARSTYSIACQASQIIQNTGIEARRCGVGWGQRSSCRNIDFHLFLEPLPKLGALPLRSPTQATHKSSYRGQWKCFKLSMVFAAGQMGADVT